VVDRKNDSQIITSTFSNGFIFIIGIFMILFSMYRRKDSILLIFGLFTICISVRAFFTVPFLYTILFPDLPWVWGVTFRIYIDDCLVDVLHYANVEMA